MAGRLNERRILVTGAASGMGLTIARLFAEEGASLALLDRNEAGVCSAAGDLGATAYGCDVADRAQVGAVIAQAGEALGGIDGLDRRLPSSYHRYRRHARYLLHSDLSAGFCRGSDLRVYRIRQRSGYVYSFEFTV